jgi:hypothetical protein
MWSMVAIAGMSSSGDAVLVMIRHVGLERREVVDALRRRWTGLSVGDLGVTPAWAMSVKDAVELADTTPSRQPEHKKHNGGEDHGEA